MRKKKVTRKKLPQKIKKKKSSVKNKKKKTSSTLTRKFSVKRKRGRPSKKRKYTKTLFRVKKVAEKEDRKIREDNSPIFNISPNFLEEGGSVDELLSEVELNDQDSILIKDFPSPLLEESEAKKIKALTFYRDDKNIKLGVINPGLKEVQAKKEALEKTEHRPVDIYLISEHSFERAFELYKAVVKIRDVEYGVKITEEVLNKFQAEIDNFDKLAEKLKEETNLTNFIAMLLASAKIDVVCVDKSFKPKAIPATIKDSLSK